MNSELSALLDELRMLTTKEEVWAFVTGHKLPRIVALVGEMENILVAATELSYFCKSHEYPKEHSAEHSELTRLVDIQDTVLRKWRNRNG